MTVIRGSLSQAFDSGLNGSLCLLILGILRLVLNFSPYRCAKSGSVFRHERKTERGPPLLVNVVRTGPLDGIDTWILSCTFRFPPFRSWPRPPSSNSSSPGKVLPRLTANAHIAQANTRRLLATREQQQRPFLGSASCVGMCFIVRPHHATH